MGVRNEDLPHARVAARWREDLSIDQGNHGATYSGRGTVFDELLVIRHFPYRSPAQVIRKVRNGAAAYAAGGSSIPEAFGAHWRQWGRILDERGEEAIAELFHTWYWRDVPRAPIELPDGERQPALLFDPAPIS